MSRHEPRRRLFVDTSIIDVTLPVPEVVLVHRETLSQLRLLPEEEAAKLLAQIILAAEHDGALKPSVAEKRLDRAHTRVIKKEDNPPHHDEESAARQHRRDLATLGLSSSVGRPKGGKTGQKRR